MEFLNAAMGNVLALFAFGLVVGAVFKLFQIATLLGEIKEMLHNIKMRQDFAVMEAPQPVPVGATGEEMLRAIDRELSLEDSTPAIDPEIVDPQA